jgi:hypothetical protein
MHMYICTVYINFSVSSNKFQLSNLGADVLPSFTPTHTELENVHVRESL